jgi:hypothetical protein
MGSANRVAGAFLGAGRMVVVIWIAYSFLGVLDADLRKAGFRVRAEESKLYQLAVEENALRLAFGSSLHHLRTALERVSLGNPRHPDAIDDVARDPRLQAISKDPTIKHWLESEDLHALRSGNVLSLITDSEVTRALDRVAPASAGEVAGKEP